MSSSRVRVATYNVYLGADLALVFAVESREHLATQAARVRDQVVATDFPARADAIAALLVRERVDVVGLQEVAEWSRATVGADGSPGDPEVWLDFLDELLAALQRAGAAYDAYASTASFAGGARVGDVEVMSVLGHNVILVRRGSGVEVTEERTGDFAAMLEIPTRMADLVLQVRRSWGWIDARAGGERFRFVNTHTEAYDEDTRNAQRDELLAALGDPGIPVVLVGDFDAGPARVGMAEEYVDAWLAGGGAGDTPVGRRPTSPTPTARCGAGSTTCGSGTPLSRAAGCVAPTRWTAPRPVCGPRTTPASSPTSTSRRASRSAAGAAP